MPNIQLAEILPLVDSTSWSLDLHLFEVWSACTCSGTLSLSGISEWASITRVGQWCQKGVGLNPSPQEPISAPQFNHTGSFWFLIGSHSCGQPIKMPAFWRHCYPSASFTTNVTQTEFIINLLINNQYILITPDKLLKYFGGPSIWEYTNAVYFFTLIFIIFLLIIRPACWWQCSIDNWILWDRKENLPTTTTSSWFQPIIKLHLSQVRLPAPLRSINQSS